MSAQEFKKLDLLSEKLDLITEKVDNIKRGVYGEEINGSKGLMKRTEENERRIKKIEEKQYKFYLYLSVGAVALQVVINIVTKLYFK